MRLIHLLIGALGALASLNVLALGLGPLEQRSVLNEPFVGRIDIVDAREVDFDSLKVGLAPAERFDAAGIPISRAVLELDFRLERGPDGAYVEVTSDNPMREPVLAFLVEAVWESGQIYREYTVLLDPPEYAMSPRARQAAASARAAAPMRAVVSSYGPVAPGETLFAIAQRVAPPGTSVNQTMIALQRANPEAFIGGNINALRRGVVLEVPPAATVRAVDKGAALAAVRSQTAAWQGAAGRRVERAGPGPRPAAGETVADAGSRLKLVAPESDTGGAPASGGDAALIEEELDARTQEARDLSAKLVEANEVIDLLQRQIEIKDNQLAELQSRLAGLDAAAPAATGEVAATPDPEPATEPEPEPAAEPEETPVDDEFADLLALPEPEAPEAIEAEPEPEAAEVPTAEADTERMPEPAPEVSIEVAKPKPAAPATPPPPPPEGPLGGLIPPHIVEAVPGGLRTLLGAGAALIVALVAVVLRVLRRRGDEETVVAKAAEQGAASDKLDNTIEQAMDTGEDIDASMATMTDIDTQATLEDATEALAAEGPTVDLESTIASSVDQTLVDVEPETDPLEEVNVYLAYERFDQAEELVRDAIERYPNEHQYKLRLLEVFYSSNETAKYEAAARDLYDAVGDQHPLWESAVAMWQEMSPQRALFEQGGDTAAAAAAGAAASAFLDLSGADETGGDTMSISPGAPEALERTQVGDSDEVEEGGEVFDITAGDDETAEADVFDLTASAGTAADDEILDLTSTTEAPSADAMIDLTSTGDLGEAMSDVEASDDVFDISGESEAAETDVFDITSSDEADLFDLGDSTKLDDLTQAPAGAPASFDDDETVNEAAARGAESRDEDQVIEFDLSDTVSPPLAQTMATDVDLDDEDAALSLTGDFELGELTGAADVEAPQTPPGPEDPLDLSLAPSEDIDEPSTDAESVDFDFSLTETSDLDDLEIEDTLELPREEAETLSSLEAGGAEDLEDEVAALGLSMDDLPDGGETDDDALDLSLDFDDGTLSAAGDDKTPDSPEGSDADTLALDEGDDFDTKLNLAKAYVELGDHDGARTILSEVRQAGTPEQRAQAEELLGDIG